MILIGAILVLVGTVTAFVSLAQLATCDFWNEHFSRLLLRRRVGIGFVLIAIGLSLMWIGGLRP